jgi:hypothetical protein
MYQGPEVVDLKVDATWYANQVQPLKYPVRYDRQLSANASWQIFHQP